MYQALYRKWRPRTFDDVIGQQQVTETLKNQIQNNRTSHAYLMIGVRGTGKTTCAKILARALNCEQPENGNPCNKCPSCLGIENGTVMDVVEIDAASNNGVENVRALRDEAVYSPASVKKRVYIIDEVHMLTTSAFNALLKILEEPPEHLVFILATTEIHKVLPTILSRCQRYSFKRIAPEAIAGRLEFVAGQENIALDHDAALLLARLADGSMRDGLSLLDQCSGNDVVTGQSVLAALGLVGSYHTAALLGHICSSQMTAAIELFENLWQEGKAPVTILNELCTLLRDIAMVKVAPQNGGQLLSGGFDDKALRELAPRMSTGQAMEYMQLIQNSIGKLRDGRDPKIEAELCLIAMCQPQLLDTPERLGLRISKLENALENGAFTGSVSAPKPVESRLPGEKHEEIATAPEEEVLSDEEAELSKSDRNKPVFEESTPDDQPKTETPALANGDFWPALYGELKSKMTIPTFVFISDASARLEDGKLIISASSDFKKKKVETAETLQIIRDASEQILGQVYPIKVEVSKDVGGSLDDLAKFGNVKFE